MKTVFRVDASSRIGAGHLIRCLALSGALRERGIDTHFFCRRSADNMAELIRRHGAPITELSGSDGGGQATGDGSGRAEAEQRIDAKQCIEALAGESVDWLVVDHYELGAEWERDMRSRVARLMVIDDMTNREHECDLFLNQSVREGGESRYHGLLPDNCQMLIGPKYALLRPEFASMRTASAARDGRLRAVLVSLTLGDDNGETLKALEGIGKFNGSLKVDVAVGENNSTKQEIESYCALHGWGFHCPTDKIADLIAQADFVVGAGGSSNWERCALGAPASITILADNQVEISEFLANLGAVQCLGHYADTTVDGYTALLQGLNPSTLRSMSRAAFEVVDGRGATRVADRLIAGAGLSATAQQADVGG